MLSSVRSLQQLPEGGYRKGLRTGFWRNLFATSLEYSSAFPLDFPNRPADFERCDMPNHTEVFSHWQNPFPENGREIPDPEHFRKNFGVYMIGELHAVDTANVTTSLLPNSTHDLSEFNAGEYKLVCLQHDDSASLTIGGNTLLLEGANSVIANAKTSCAEAHLPQGWHAISVQYGSVPMNERHYLRVSLHDPMRLEERYPSRFIIHYTHSGQMCPPASKSPTQDGCAPPLQPYQLRTEVCFADEKHPPLQVSGGAGGSGDGDGGSPDGDQGGSASQKPDPEGGRSPMLPADTPSGPRPPLDRDSLPCKQVAASCLSRRRGTLEKSEWVGMQCNTGVPTVPEAEVHVCVYDAEGGRPSVKGCGLPGVRCKVDRQVAPGDNFMSCEVSGPLDVGDKDVRLLVIELGLDDANADDGLRVVGAADLLVFSYGLPEIHSMQVSQPSSHLPTGSAHFVTGLEVTAVSPLRESIFVTARATAAAWPDKTKKEALQSSSHDGAFNFTIPDITLPTDSCEKVTVEASVSWEILYNSGSAIQSCGSVTASTTATACRRPVCELIASSVAHSSSNPSGLITNQPFAELLLKCTHDIVMCAECLQVFGPTRASVTSFHSVNQSMRLFSIKVEWESDFRGAVIFDMQRSSDEGKCTYVTREETCSGTRATTFAPIIPLQADVVDLAPFKAIASSVTLCSDCT